MFENTKCVLDTPEIKQAGKARCPDSPRSQIGRSKVFYYTRRMWVRVDEWVRSYDDLLRHGC